MNTDKKLTPEEIFLKHAMHPLSNKWAYEQVFLRSMEEYGQQEEAIGYERGKKEANELNRTGVVEYMRSEANVIQNESMFLTDNKLVFKYNQMAHFLRTSASYLELIQEKLPAPPQQGKEAGA